MRTGSSVRLKMLLWIRDGMYYSVSFYAEVAVRGRRKGELTPGFVAVEIT